MTKHIGNLYHRFRHSSPFMLVGHNARLALASAKRLDRWEDLEADGLVKIEAEPDNDPDPSFYDTWPHMSERTLKELKDKYCSDCWTVSTYYRQSIDHAWERADSICGISGYRNPCDPFESCYVIDLMTSALDMVEEYIDAETIEEQTEAAYTI